MEKSTISVIIPAYNRARLIGQTLSSILNQTLPADEIIVVDDGSTDSTVDAAEAEFAVFRRQFSGKGKLPEFKVIRQKNAGPGAARNRGFAESKGEFIHFFDSDDIAAPNKHEVQVRALQESGADIAYGPWVKGQITEHGAGPLACSAGGSERSAEQSAKGKRYSFEPEGHVLQQKGLPQGDLIKELLTRWSIVPQACMFRRSITENCGGFPDDMFVAEDQLMFLRALLNGGKVVHTPQTLTFYRLGGAGKLTESAEGHRRRITDWAEFLQRANNGCTKRGVYPMRWFGFRKRLWGAKNDVETLSGAIGGSFVGRSGRCYRVVSLFQKWCGGAKVRLTGNRHNAAFRAGQLTAEQKLLFPSV